MATVEMFDYRRHDLRTQVHETPFWITSSEIDEADCEDLAAVLFSFPNADERYIIHNMLLEVTEAFAGGTPALTVGIGTLATDDVTTGGDVTTVDVDEYYTNTEAAPTALGLKLPGVAADYGAAWVANALSSPTASAELLIQGAAATVPAVVVYASSSTSLTAGKCRLHMLISKLPPSGYDT